MPIFSQNKTTFLILFVFVLLAAVFAVPLSKVYATHTCGQACSPANTCPHGCNCICGNQCTTGNYGGTCPSSCCGGGGGGGGGTSCKIQGYKVMMPGNVPAAPASGQTVTISGVGSYATQPYIVTAAGTHTVSVSVPAGYTAGFTLCYNSNSCHTSPPIMASSVSVNCNVSYTDLWWHFFPFSPSITTIPTVPVNPTATPTPPAPVTSATNPRGCGILYTSGVASCWCNNGGGQGNCVDPALNRNLSINQCRTLCENGTFNGPLGYTHCFMMTNGQECASNNDGSYRFCLNECMRGNPGYMHTVGCIYPNTTIFGPATRSAACDAALQNSSNATFLTMIENLIRGAMNSITANNYRLNLIRVPGLQKTTCNPFKLECERGYSSF